MPTPYCPGGFREDFYVLAFTPSPTSTPNPAPREPSWVLGPYPTYNEAVDVGAYIDSASHFVVEKRFTPIKVRVS